MSRGIFSSFRYRRQRPLFSYLHHAEQLDSVVLPVVEDLVAEHGAHGVVTHVVGDSDAAPASSSCLVTTLNTQ